MSGHFEAECVTVEGDKLLAKRLMHNGRPGVFSVIVMKADGTPNSAHLSIEDARRLFSWLGAELHRWRA